MNLRQSEDVVWLEGRKSHVGTDRPEIREDGESPSRPKRLRPFGISKFAVTCATSADLWSKQATSLTPSASGGHTSFGRWRRVPMEKVLPNCLGGSQRTGQTGGIPRVRLNLRHCRITRRRTYHMVTQGRMPGGPEGSCRLRLNGNSRRAADRKGRDIRGETLNRMTSPTSIAISGRANSQITAQFGTAPVGSFGQIHLDCSS